VKIVPKLEIKNNMKMSKQFVAAIMMSFDKALSEGLNLVDILLDLNIDTIKQGVEKNQLIVTNVPTIDAEKQAATIAAMKKEMEENDDSDYADQDEQAYCDGCDGECKSCDKQ